MIFSVVRRVTDWVWCTIISVPHQTVTTENALYRPSVEYTENWGVGDVLSSGKGDTTGLSCGWG